MDGRRADLLHARRIAVRIVITGAKGQLGCAVLQEALRRGHDAIGADIEDFDLTDKNAVHAYLTKAAPDFVIHCAAYTAVDKAESEPELARAVNEFGTRYIAEYCAARDVWMLCVSTDYVFGGSGSAPWEVDDTLNPLSVYGATKLAGEQAAQSLCGKHMIVRTSWVFGPEGNHFVKTMLCLGGERTSLNIVSDQVGSPTYTIDLARLLCDMAERPQAGIYHAANAGYCSWAEFAAAVFAQAGISCEVREIPSSEYPQAAQRPLNSRLSPKSLIDAGYAPLPPWQDALRRYLNEGKI